VRAAGLTGLLAVACALLLPFAPVAVSAPTVSWPRDPARVESTLLPLTAARPLALDVRFGCDVVRLAAGTAGDAAGVVLATALPGSAQAGATALLVTAAGDRLQVRARGRVLIDEAVPAGPCVYRVTGRGTGRPVDLGRPPGPAGRVDPAVPAEREPPDPAAVAGPADAELVVSRDGVELARAADALLPDVDALVSAPAEVPAGGLAVTLRVDDEATSSPTAVKSGLLAALVLALAATAVLLAVADRGPPRRRWRTPGPALLVDAGVLATLVFWTLVAPATDDDGYFAAQVRNAVLTGAVTDYYSFHGRAFTPFTWPYQGLAEWTELVGTAPVLLRVPAAVCGLLTWLAVRGLVGTAGGGAGRAVAAVAFLAWWLPYGMGVRPEPAVALCAAVAVLGVQVAARTGRLLPGWLAAAAAGAGVAAHPTGVVAVAGLLAGSPLLVPLLRGTAAARAAAVFSGASAGMLLGFADGALRDVTRGRAAVGAVLTTDGWADEAARYVYLLDPIPMGGFAKRAAVLTALLALAWWAVLAAAAWARRVATPVPLALTGSATALGFAALWLTPSKWTHHFGALAGVGAAFLGLFLAAAVPLAGRLLAGRRCPWGLAAAVAGSAAVACALVWHGPNSWAYARLDGVAAADVRPHLAGVTADHPVAWLLGIGLVAAGLPAARRGGAGPGPAFAVVRAVPAVLTTSLAAAVVFLVGAFGTAAARGVPPESVWAQGLADPAGERCGAAGATSVLDPATSRPLPALGPPGALDGFVADRGFFAGDRPPPGPVWGSFVPRDGLGAERTVGSAETAWYALPEAGAVTVAAAGNLGDGTTLTAVYRRAGAEPARQPLADGTTSPHWRTLRLTPPAGADAVRIEAADVTGAPHGWLAFTAPAVQDAVPLQRFLPPDAPVALGWQLAFGHPCQRLPAVVGGVTEPATFAVVRTAQPAAPPLAGLADLAWQADRGGVFAAVPRSQSVLQLATVGGDPSVQVYAFTSPLARAAYTVTPGTRTVAGADPTAG
jgi:hypothetical protein